MRGIQETQEMFSKILGNLLEDSREYWFFNFPLLMILGNVQEDSREYQRKFRVIFKKIPENVWKDSVEHH